MAATTDKPVLTETTNTADEPGDVGSPESARSKADDKKKLKAEAAATAEAVSALGAQIEQFERAMAAAASPAERETAKARKRAVREAQKAVADRSVPLEQRLLALQARYVAQVSDTSKADAKLLEAGKELEGVNREKDRLQAELRRTLALKDKLEELCRGLQAENKNVWEESKKIREADRTERLALQQRFQDAIADVQVKMDAQQEARSAQVAENESLREKLGDFIKQFEAREELYSKQLAAKDAEIALMGGRLEEQVALNKSIVEKASAMAGQNDNLIASHRELLAQAEMAITLKAENARLAASNAELKAQVDVYASKLDEFQGTLAASNKVFGDIKADMEAHSKARAALVKERDALARQANDAVRLAKSLADERDRFKLQKERLEGLCRMLQAQVRGGAAVGDAASEAAGEAAATDAAEASGAGAPAGSSGEVTGGAEAAAAAATQAEVGAEPAAAAGGEGSSAAAEGSGGAGGSS